MNQMNRRQTLVVCLLLGLGVLALYSPALGYHFIDYDDPAYVVRNPAVNHGFTGEGLFWAIRTGSAGAWQPLAWISHMLDSAVFGLHPWGHHLTSILLHAVNSVLVFLVLARMTGAFWRSAVVAGLFGWHPLQVETAAWISDRNDLLSAFFFLLTLWAYAAYAGRKRAEGGKTALFYLLALGLFALSLASKPAAVMLPFVLLLLDWWPLGRMAHAAQPLPADAGSAAPSPRASLVSLVVEKIPFFCLSLGATVLAVWAERREGSLHLFTGLPMKGRVIVVANAYYRYLRKIIWPTGLAPLYPSFVPRHKWEVLGIVVVLGLISIFALQLRKSRPFWFTGWFWFALLVFPVTNILAESGQFMADHHMYLPSIGLFLLVVWEVYDAVAASAFGRQMAAGLALTALAACCVISVLQLRIWRNDGTLLAHIALPSSNAVAHANYAAYLMSQNELPKAEEECAEAVQIAPRSGYFAALLGDAYLMDRKYDDSIAAFNHALQVDPSLSRVRVPLGRALLAKKRPNDAVAQFVAAAKADPRNFEAHTWLGKLLEAAGKSGQALQEYRATLALQPNQPDALNDAAWIMATDHNATLRNPGVAVQLSKKACALTRESDPMLLGTLAASYAADGQFDLAVTTAQKAHDLAAAHGNKRVAERNLQLIALYRRHKPYQEK